MRAAQNVVARLKHAREVRTGEWRAACPAHQGKSRSSLAVKDTGDKALIHCFNGCGTEEILSALGLSSPRELFDDSAGRQQHDPSALRQQRVLQGLKIWADQRLVTVCEQIREIDLALSGFNACVELHNDPSAISVAFDLIALRDHYEREFEILNRGYQDEVKTLWQSWRRG